MTAHWHRHLLIDCWPDFVYSDPANSKMLLAELAISNFSWKHSIMCFKQARKHKNNMKNIHFLCQGKVLLWNLEDDKHKPIQCSEDVQVQRKLSKS